MRKEQTGYLVLLLAFITVIRLLFLSLPKEPVFDELHYIPYLLNYLSGQPVVLPHPPLGIMLLGAGVQIFGENPIGWRIFPVIFSLLGLGLTFYLGKSLTSSSRIGFYAAFLLAFSPSWFVFSRLAMLEMFLTVFLLGMIIFYLKRNFLLCGLFLGLAAAVKWTAGFIIVLLLLRELGLIISKKGRPAGLKNLTAALLLGGLVYFLISGFFYKDFTFSHFLNREKRIVNYHLTGVKTDLSYTTPAWSWLLIPQAIVAYQGDKGEILITENPALLWLGLLGVGLVLWQLF